MRNLNNLFIILDNEKISLEENLQIPGVNGIYICIPSLPPLISLRSDLNSANYYSILAEEIGHHFTTVGNMIPKNNSYIANIIKNKYELKAKRWASNFIVSDEEFVQALLNCNVNKYELCNMFDVNEEIINNKIYSITLNEDKYNDIKKCISSHEIPYSVCNI